MGTAELSTRIATPGDAADVTRLMLAWRDHLGANWPPPEAWRSGIERLLGDPSTTFVLGAHGNGAPAGVVLLRFKWGLWRNGLDCWIEDVFVDAPARGSGLGRALLQATIDLGRDRGVRRFELDTREDNVAARALYESFGFVNRATPATARDLLYTLVVGA